MILRMSKCCATDDLARALDKARQAHDRQQTPASYVALLEAEVAFLRAWGRAECARRDRTIRRERARATEIGKRLQEARSAERDREQETLQTLDLLQSPRQPRRGARPLQPREAAPQLPGLDLAEVGP